MSCSQCQGIESQFDQKTAAGDLKSYHKKGLPKSTQLLVEEIKKRGIQESTLLDIGGGVGMIQHELIKAGLTQATHVDASSAYLNASQEEAERQGHGDRVEYKFGNFVDLAGEIDHADIVTLDKVICCFDDMRALVARSSAKAKNFYGVIFPRDTWWLKFGFRILNKIPFITKDGFNTFLHPTQEIEDLISANGLKRSFYHRGLFWQVIGYSR
ncbi:MAG: class I SAM-dependent methyltransferase [Anaerolineae bacterium]|nr:class I SAM-dependent methyltransferase [Anaerolineae bacterium]